MATVVFGRRFAGGRPAGPPSLCNDLGIAIDLAVHGAGVALVSDTLAAHDLKRNALVKAFPLAIDIFGGWHVISFDRSLKRSAVRLFLRWLLTCFGRRSSLENLLTT
ncbi:hypothetical protein AJ87_01375 [Rhizobium yanglingense]|nr:hypothetical protein AJ87_01375 [Rhizobium yanglingense]